MTTPRRFSLNQRTIPSWTALEAIEKCAASGVEAIGLWREPVAEDGIDVVAAATRAAGLRVSSLCRGGFFAATDDAGRRAALDDNRRAVEEAAVVGAECLVLVPGGLPDGSRDLSDARAQVADGIAALADTAAANGVRLAIEPMHPIYCADRGVVSTLAQALELAAPFPADLVGVVVDTFHVWWDPCLAAAVAQAGPRIASFQVSDWITPMPPDPLLARGVVGDGHIDLSAIRSLVDAAGYRGDIEVEIFNADVWAAPPDYVLATAIDRHRRFVEPDE